jgi:uncharacterized protein YhfF/RimJ/RimL family protein N-acetyltransferase
MASMPSVDEVVASLSRRGIHLPQGHIRLDQYGDSPALSKQLLGLIRSGQKRAGTGLVWLHEHEQETYGNVGDIEIVLTHDLKPALVTRLTQVDVVPYGQVDAPYAAIEGEGDGSLAYWRQAHDDYFSRVCRSIGRTPSDDMLVVCSVFEVLHVIAPVVSLEPRTMAHAEALFPVLAEPALYHFIDEAPPTSVQALRDKLARSESRKSPDGTEHWLNWVVRDDTGQVAGYVQATVAANLDTHVAYAIGSAFWGQGLATEAVAQMLRLVAADHGVTRFFIMAERQNTRSVHVAMRLGFAEVAPEEAQRRHIAVTDVLLQKLECTR